MNGNRLIDDCRKAFEEWADGEGYNLKPNDESIREVSPYWGGPTTHAWEGWKSAWKAATESQDVISERLGKECDEWCEMYQSACDVIKQAADICRRLNSPYTGNPDDEPLTAIQDDAEEWLKAAQPYLKGNGQ